MSDIEPGTLLHADSGEPTGPVAGSPVSSPTAGQMLRQARLRSGLTLEELGARVKVTIARLDALEDDRLDAWPNINLMRAAASSVCRLVQLDPSVILDRLPKAEKMQITVAGPQANVGFPHRGGFTLRRAEGTGRSTLPLILATFLLLAALIYFGPTLADLANQLLARDVPMAVPTVAGSVTDPVLPPDAGPTDTRVGLVATEPVASAPIAAGVSASNPPAPVAPQEPLVVIKAKGLTWIAVSDAKGVTLLRKTLSAGETASASGALPLWVVVGRAENAEVLVRGAAVVLEPSVPDNVARFKVQ